MSEKRHLFQWVFSLLVRLIEYKKNKSGIKSNGFNKAMENFIDSFQLQLKPTRISIKTYIDLRIRFMD